MNLFLPLSWIESNLHLSQIHQIKHTSLLADNFALKPLLFCTLKAVLHNSKEAKLGPLSFVWLSCKRLVALL